MERSAIFVDAGYLLAAGGGLICGTSSRAGFKCDYAGLTAKLADWAEQHNRGRFNAFGPTGTTVRLMESLAVTTS